MKFSDEQMEQLGSLLDERLELKLEEKLEEKLTPIRKDIRKIKLDLKTTIEFFDDEHLSLRKRVERIEKHLHLSHTA